MDIKDSIRIALERQEEEKRLAELAKQKENQDPEEPKDHKYLIKGNDKGINIPEFLSNFEQAYDIEELVDGTHYSFRIKNDDEQNLYSIMSEVYKDYSDEIVNETMKNKSVMDIVLDRNFNDAYIDVFRDHHKNLKETLKKSDDWDIKVVNEHEAFKNVDMDAVKDSFATVIHSVYDFSEEDSKRLVDISFKHIQKELAQHSTILGTFHLGYLDIEPKIKEPIRALDNYLDTRMALSDSMRKMGNQSSENIRTFFDTEERLQNDIMKEFGENTLKMRDFEKWEDAYFGDDNKVMKELDDKLFNVLKDSGIPNGETVCGYPTFGFFNYYNMSQKSYSTTRPLIKEFTQVILSEKIVRDREEVAQKIENVITEIQNGNKPEDNAFDFVKKTVIKRNRRNPRP
jgi:hypothetical protein